MSTPPVSIMRLLLLLTVICSLFSSVYSRCHVHLEHGFVTRTSTGHGESVLSFGCRPNYLLHGPTSVTCTDGTLSSGHADVHCAPVHFAHDPAVEPPTDYEFVATNNCQDVSTKSGVVSCPIGYGPTAAGALCPIPDGPIVGRVLALPIGRVSRHQLLLNGSLSTVYEMDIQCASGRVNVNPTAAHARCCSFNTQLAEPHDVAPFHMHDWQWLCDPQTHACPPNSYLNTLAQQHNADTQHHGRKLASVHDTRQHATSSSSSAYSSAFWYAVIFVLLVAIILAVSYNAYQSLEYKHLLSQWSILQRRGYTGAVTKGDNVKAWFDRMGSLNESGRPVAAATTPINKEAAISPRASTEPSAAVDASASSTDAPRPRLDKGRSLNRTASGVFARGMFDTVS